MFSLNSNQITYQAFPNQNWVTFIKVLFISVVAVHIYIADSSAQISQLEVGDRVRITAPLVEQDKIAGTVTEIDNTVLVLAVKDSSFYISESMIHNLETSVGKRRVVGRGMLIGAVVGTMMSGVVSAVANNACGIGEDCVLANRDGEAFLAGATFGLLIGAAVGTVTGFFTKIDEWERVPFSVAVESESFPVQVDKRSLNPTLTFRFSLGD